MPRPLALTIAEGRTVFYSRSRQETLAQGRDQRQCAACGCSITADCDKDALVVEVVKDGPRLPYRRRELLLPSGLCVGRMLKQFTWQGL